MVIMSSKFISNPFHLVEFRPWPIVGSTGALFVAIGLAAWFHGEGLYLISVGLVIVVLTMLQW